MPNHRDQETDESVLEATAPALLEMQNEALFHIARVLSFVPGQLLGDATLTPALGRYVGATAARLARALRGYSHPAARHELLGHFESEVLPLLMMQRAQVIHNDVSEMNTLVDGSRATGVIDFGDLIHARWSVILRCRFRS